MPGASLQPGGNSVLPRGLLQGELLPQLTSSIQAEEPGDSYGHHALLFSGAGFACPTTWALLSSFLGSLNRWVWGQWPSHREKAPSP